MIVTMADVDNLQDKNFKLHRPNGRGDYLFVLFKSPSFVMVNGVYTQADTGDYIIFDKHKIQSYFPARGEIFCHDFLHFNTEGRSEAVLLQDIPMGITRKSYSPERLTNILKEIKEALSCANSKYKKDILDRLATAFIYRIKNELAQEVASSEEKHHRALLAIRNEIYLSPAKSRTVEQVCKRICLSRSYFQHLYKRFFGISYVNDVINARIDLAKNLLIVTSHSINDIAEHCGYNSSSHFIRQFTSKVGMSPNKFRNGF